MGLGDVYAASGDFTNAKKSYEESLAISREAGEKHESAVALASLGAALTHQGDLAGAGEKIREAISLRNELGEKSGVAEVSLLWRTSRSKRDKLPRQSHRRGRHWQPFGATKMPELEIQARVILAQSLLAQGKVNLAQKEIAQGKSLAEKTQQRLIRLRFEIAAAQIQAASGKPSDLQAARNTLEAVIHETEKMQALSDLFEARFVRADLELKYGNRVTGGTLVAGVQKDAGASGFALIAKKAADAAGRSKENHPKPGNGTRQVLP